MTQTSSDPAPLAGIKIVEFTHMVMGPTVGHVMASLGAEVIRVEPIGGDRTRRLLGSGAGYFPMFNRGKQSICLNLKSQEGLEAAKGLIAASDVLVENYRPGAMAKLGLGYCDCAAVNPGLIYCSEKGFLPGPYENRTALDEVAQMMGGLAYMTGPPGKPLRAGASVIDITGGLFGVIGILAALQERARTGKGQEVVASLFETTAYLVGQHMAQFGVTGQPAAPMPARVFIGVVTDPLWEKFCNLFELDELWADEGLRENNNRVLARDRIMPLVRDVIGRFTQVELIQRLEGTGLPFAPIAKPEDLLQDPQLVEGGLEPVTMVSGETIQLPTLPLTMDGKRRSVPQQMEPAGAHSRDLLKALGYTCEETDALIAAGAAA